MKRIFVVLMLCAVCLFGVAAAQETGGGSSDEVPFETICKGVSANGIVERTALVVNDADGFLSVWEMIAQGVFPAPEAPSVDFETKTVIFVSSGVMPSGGYDVEIEGIVAADGGLDVYVLAHEPPEDATVTAALTQPYHGVTIDKTDLPVRFHWKTEIR
jgi:hypothetical protein